MNFPLAFYLLSFALAVCIAAALAFVAWQKRFLPIQRVFASWMAATAGWALSGLLETLAAGIPLKLLFHEISFCFSMVIAVSALRYVADFSMGEKQNLRWVWRAAYAATGIWILAALTNHWHGGLWVGAAPGSDTAYPIHYPFGILFYLASAYQLFFVGLTFLLLGRTLLIKGQPRRREAGVLLLAIFLPAAANLVSNYAGSTVGGWNLTPAGAVLSGLVLVWSLMRGGLFDLMPVAREELLESLVDGVVVVDRFDRVVDINQTARRLLGGTGAPRVGSTLGDVIGRITQPDSRVWVLPDSRLEIQISSQSRRWLELRVSPLAGRAGGAPGKIILLRDISERREAEERSAHLATEYRFALEHMQTNVFRLRKRPDGEIEYVLNEGPLPQSLGQTTDQVVGKRLQDVMGEGLARMVRPFCEKAFRGEFVSYEVELGPLVLLTILSPIRVEGDVTEVAGSSVDITERIGAERALQQREAYLRSMLDNFPFKAWLKNREGRYLAVNHAFAREAGFEGPDQVRGRTDAELWLPEDAEQFQREDQSVLAGGKTLSEEVRQTVQGRSVWTEKEIVPVFDDDGNPVGTVGFARDITARKLTEQTLAEALELNQTIIATSTLGILAYREDGQCILANAAAGRIVGAPEAALLEQNFRLLASWRSSGLLGAALEALDRGEVVHREFHHFTTFGREVWLAGSLSRFTSNGERRLLVVVADITERRIADQALRSSEEKFRSLVDSMEEIVFTLDANCRHTGVYGRWLERLGQLPADYIGRTAEDLFGPEAGAPHLDAARRALKGEFAVYDWSVPDGSGMRHYRTSLSPIRSADGQVTGLVGIGHDITEQQMMAVELETAKTLLESALEQTPIPMMLVDAPDGAIRIVNPACRNMLGIENEADYIGVRLAELDARKSWCDVDEQDRPLPGADQPLARALRGESIQNREYGVVRKDGQKRWQRITAVPIFNKERRTIAAFSVLADVTQSKLADAMLRVYAAQLERSNRDLQDFASSASHDLQEPLRKIQAFGERLQSKYNAQLGDDGKDYLARMVGAASRMQDMINALLDYSRVSTRGQPFVPVQLEEVAREAVSDLETRLEQSQGRVDVGALPEIEADPLQMRLMIQNLIGNALKFRAPDRPPVVRLWAETVEGDTVRLHVEDNGIGFDTRYLSRIFQPFQRLHGRGEYEGSGMGLAICRRILERHGGDITAESEPGRGTSFLITLPVRRANRED